MTRRMRVGALLALCSLLCAPLAPRASAAGPALPAPWTMSGTGLLDSLPEMTIGQQDNGLRGAFRLAPRSGVVFEEGIRVPVDDRLALSLEFAVSAANRASKDYVPGRQAFPVSVTLVFGKDSAKRPFGDLLYDFFAGPWYGLFSGGIRLTYAWGHDAPVGSMYRLVESETVFILAGPDEEGKTIASKRRVLADFQAAYARPPKGPVTRVIVRLERPSADRGAASDNVAVGFPAP